jgi:hypothetical protein
MSDNGQPLDAPISYLQALADGAKVPEAVTAEVNNLAQIVVAWAAELDGEAADDLRAVARRLVALGQRVRKDGAASVPVLHDWEPEFVSERGPGQSTRAFCHLYGYTSVEGCRTLTRVGPLVAVAKDGTVTTCAGSVYRLGTLRRPPVLRGLTLVDLCAAEGVVLGEQP